MYCEFESMNRFDPPSITLKIYNNDDILVLIVTASYRYKAYRFDYSNMAYGFKECLDFLISNKLAIICKTTKEPDMVNYKFPRIYKLKLTPKALMYAL